ncbi:MAG: hypothetical protein COW85_05400 [Ignavibacteria bacterium CG22_combo_CG10-13_8_21_14_all_37_15]|nr:MAG: hypothetical protein COW85_05400 [Ignavibacteria bacterium CG22_combo_CG10-13_8_21_14_all_37_15]
MKKENKKMKKLMFILIVFILSCNLIFAQQNIFEKMSTGFTTSKSVKEKINRFKSREEIKLSEQLLLKSNIVLSKNFKGVFNILDKNIEFEITKDFGKNVRGVQGFKAELKEGGYAILSSSVNGIGAAIWYQDTFYSIEPAGDGIYFVSEIDRSEMAKHECQQNDGSINQLNKTVQHTSVNSVLSPANIKVFVAYTPAAAQNYNVGTLIPLCEYTTNYAFDNSLVSSTIEIVGSQQLTYVESGYATTDVNRFMTLNDTYLEEIHSLRNQYEADVCVLLVNSLDANGIVPTGAIGAVLSNAFCVVKASAAASIYSFPHELGHLLGCRHDNDNGTYPYSNAHGYNWFGKLSYSSNSRFYRTIMSVEDESKYMRVPYFSNPYVYDQLNNPMGTTNYNYSASAIDDYASVIEGFDPQFTASITMSGSWGQNPTLTFSANQSDIDHYILKKEYDLGSGWGTPVYVNPASNPYTDYNVLRSKTGDLSARYSVQAIDENSYASAYSSYVSTLGQSQWKNEGNEDTPPVIKEYSLLMNYPNPFNPSTTIGYQLPAKSFVTLKVFDFLGNEVATLVNEWKEPGDYNAQFTTSGKQLASGMYFYTLTAGKFSDTKKFILLK